MFDRSIVEDPFSVAGSPPPIDAVRRRMAVGHVIGASIAIVAAAALAGIGWAWEHPAVEIRNHLLDAVEVALPNETRRIAPATTTRFRVPRGNEKTLNWETLREPGSRSANGLGLKIARRRVLDLVSNPFATTVIDVKARDRDGAYFAPVVTNASTEPLRLVTNWQLSAGSGTPLDQDCQCVIPPGAARQFVGYYRLYANSNVRAITPSGTVATFENVGGVADDASGQLLLKFSSADFLKP